MLDSGGRIEGVAAALRPPVQASTLSCSVVTNTAAARGRIDGGERRSTTRRNVNERAHEVAVDAFVVAVTINKRAHAAHR
jgi:hypothetical protein